MRSDAHAGHSAGYRRIVQRHAEAIRAAAADALMRHLKPAHIQDDLRGLTPVQGRDRMMAWRLICAHALERGLIRSDPSGIVRRPAPPKHVGRPTWAHEQIKPSAPGGRSAPGSARVWNSSTGQAPGLEMP